MGFKLDLRRPTLILLGQWNPAIFTVPWVGIYLFGFNEGDQIELGVIQENETGRRIFSFGDLAIASEPGRILLYATDTAQFEQLRALALKLYRTLPHTPVGPIGINFDFFPDGEEQYFDRLETSEPLDVVGRQIRHEVKTVFDFGEDTILNLKRTRMDTGTLFSFNFHMSLSEMEEICRRLETAAIENSFAKTREILLALYNSDWTSTVSFNDEAENADA